MFTPLTKRFAVSLLILTGLIGWPLTAPAFAQLDFEQAPINYEHAESHDPVAQLQSRIDRGEVKLEYSPEHGYLPAVLKELGVSPASQMLVFSKTSFQLSKIAPYRPRAVYFNDSCYVGWVQDGDVVEVSSVDPDLGGVFYTLSQEQDERPQFVRDRGQCLACHASSRTQGVPGHLVRSVYTSPSGQPHFGSGTFTTDHRSPFNERWGGWYVTGEHGALRHMGNILAKDRHHPENIDREQGANVCELKPLVNVSPYMQPTSDIVALMVLEHQSQMHNFLTLASYTSRQAAYQDSIVSTALNRAADYQSESTQRRIASAGEKLLEYLLFRDEFALTAKINPSSDFAAQFQQLGPRDSKGRSLRDLDLETRLFRYPCSYLIYSPSFAALPPSMKQYVSQRLGEILTGQDTSGKFTHLSPDDRQNILEILRETCPEVLAPVSSG
ncbi:MAG: hypothetical protein KDB23_06345 [Planctomycetales bacterium]|nr:hypothetical protein [Planctomycetales bacterium]